MKNKFFKSFLRSFSAAGSVVGIVLLCVLLAAVFVWPLWLWATKSQASYTVCVLAVSAAVILWQIFRAAKKMRPRRLAFIFARLVIFTAGILLAVWLVLRGLRLLAALALVAEIFILVAMPSYRKTREQNLMR